MKTLVIGLGNPLVSDDSVGLRVVALLRPLLAERPDVTVDEDYWGGLRLMERMIGYDRAIVIDAIRSGAPAGTIHRLGTADIATQRSASAHDVNLPTALAFGRQAGAELPADERVLLVGIEAEDILTFGERLTPAVEEAIPRAVQTVLQALDDPPAGSSHPPSEARGAQTMISPEVLRRYPYFGGISDESLKKVAMLAEEITVPGGTQMFREGDPACYLYLILRGEVNIQYLLGTGELRTVDTLVAGDLLVWSALIEPYKTTAFGTTTKEAQMVRIAAAPLRELCDKDPLLGYRLTTEVAKLLSHRLEGARIQLAAVD